MVGTIISHYRIIEKLGEGGMGVVYKAEDTKLDRLVALKFLPSHLSASDQDKARFIQEAKAAAALNHPNVCSVIDISEHAGQQFIVMEFVDGMTLRSKIAGGSLKLDNVIPYALQIGDALQEAHIKGIVHRDIKADNIMINSKNQVKVMDFGLAKLKGSLKLTRTSSTVGTLAYMAPEQIQGGDTDTRSDIFSFGVVLYEMLTGHMPFRGEHEAAMMYSILNEEPDSLTKYLPDTSSELLHILGRALDKDPADRYQSAAEIVVDLRRVQKKSSGLSRVQLAQVKGRDFEKAIEDAGLTTTTIPITKSRRLTYLYWAFAFLFLTVIAAGYFLFFKQEEPLTSLAVMPFANATGNQSLEYLTDGITESIISNLSRLSNLRVMSHSSVFRYKGKEINPQEVGKTLGVRAVLTGRITERPGGFSISLELVDSRDNRQIWGDHYTRSLSNISTLETEIPKEISEQLRVRLSGEERENLTTASTSNPEAYQLYLQGRFNWNKRVPEALYRAIDLYTQAIDKDPMYVQAYTGLAETHVIMPVYIFPPPKDAYEKGKYYALKALEIDSKRAEAFSTLGFAKWCEFDFEGGEKDFKRAIQLNPGYATARHWYALLLTTSGRHDEALAEARKAQELDPLSLVIQVNLGVVHSSAGRYQEAIGAYQNVFKVDPNFPLAHLLLGSTYRMMGKKDEAISEFEKAQLVLGDVVSPYLASSYALLGKSEEARRILAKFEANVNKGEKLEGAISLVYIALGEKEKALEWLEKLSNSRFINNNAYYMELRGLPKLSGMYSDPRIQAALTKIGVK